MEGFRRKIDQEVGEKFLGGDQGYCPKGLKAVYEYLLAGSGTRRKLVGVAGPKRTTPRKKG
jgi:hypothetical protein